MHSHSRPGFNRQHFYHVQIFICFDTSIRRSPKTQSIKTLWMRFLPCSYCFQITKQTKHFSIGGGVSNRDDMPVVPTETKDTRHLQIANSAQVVKAFTASARGVILSGDDNNQRLSGNIRKGEDFFFSKKKCCRKQSFLPRGSSMI